MAARTPKLRPIKAVAKGARVDAHGKVRLSGDRLLVRVPDESERRSKGGLLIPATAATPIRRCVWSEVILAGPETRNVKRGARGLFIPHTGLEADVDGEVF